MYKNILILFFLFFIISSPQASPTKVRLNTASPTPNPVVKFQISIETDIKSQPINGDLILSLYASKSPLKRNISHEEVANTSLFLLSDLATGITGAIIPVDAGYGIMGL